MPCTMSRATSMLGGQEVRVVALLPGQGLQPHAHDDMEDITVRSSLNLI